MLKGPTKPSTGLLSVPNTKRVVAGETVLHGFWLLGPSGKPRWFYVCLPHWHDCIWALVSLDPKI